MADPLLLFNAKVLTMEQAQPRAEAVLIAGDRICYVGSAKEARALAPRAELLDCRGGVVLPGFSDAHTHLFSYAETLSGVACSPEVAPDIPALQQRLREKAAITPPGQWLRAWGYHESLLRERRHPTRQELDAAAPHHPVRLAHRTGHALVLNTLGLARAGITPHTPDPVDGVIVRDPSGEPTGLLLEMNAFLAERLGPLVSEEELREGVRRVAQEYLALGVTSVHEATMRNNMARWRRLRAFQEEELPLRVTMMIGWEALAEAREAGLTFGHGDDTLRLGHLKLFLHQTTGRLMPPPEELTTRVVAASRAGFPVAFHAVEPPEVEAALEALEEARSEGSPVLPHRLEHCSLCPPRTLNRLVANRVAVVSQPAFLYYHGDRYLDQVPPEDQAWLYRFRSWLRAGLTVAASSDCPVAPPSPIAGIYGAVTRRTACGALLTAEEAITVEEALGLYTLGAARAAQEEHHKGSLRSGKLADLVLLSADPTVLPPEELLRVRVEATILGGQLVWRRPGGLLG